MSSRTLTLELDERAWQRLDRLAAAIPMSVEDLVLVLLDHVQAGLYRPDSWERGWLAQVVGDEAIREALSLKES